MGNTCRAAGLPICEPEPEPESSSVSESVPVIRVKPPQAFATILCDCIKKLEELKLEDAAEEGKEQSFEYPSTLDEEPQFEKIQVELQKLKEEVDQIHERLSLNIEECPDAEDCPKDMNIELNKHNLHPEILVLYRHNQQLSELLNQVQLSCKAADWSLQHLRDSICRHLSTSAEMEQRLNKLNSLKLQTERKQALCRQRYRHLQEEKYEWVDCVNFLSKWHEDCKKDMDKYVLKTDIMNCKDAAVNLLNKTKIEAMKAHDYLAENMAQLKQMVDPDISPDLYLDGHFGMDVSAFLKCNKHLLGDMIH